MKNSTLLYALGGTVCCLLFTAVAAYAQPGSGGPTPGAVTAVPIDGGVSLLLAAGGAYGLRRLRLRRAKK